LTIGDAAAAAILIREAFRQSRAAESDVGGRWRNDGERFRQSCRARRRRRKPLAVGRRRAVGEKDGALLNRPRLGGPGAGPGRGIEPRPLAAGEAEAPGRRGLKRIDVRVRLALEENQRLFAGFGFSRRLRAGRASRLRPADVLVMEKRLAWPLPVAGLLEEELARGQHCLRSVPRRARRALERQRRVGRIGCRRLETYLRRLRVASPRPEEGFDPSAAEEANGEAPVAYCGGLSGRGGRRTLSPSASNRARAPGADAAAATFTTDATVCPNCRA